MPSYKSLHVDVFGGPILFCMGANIFGYLDSFNHWDRHLEQQETEKIESEVREVLGYESRNVYTHAAQGGLLGVQKSTPVKHKQMYFSPQPAAPHL